jgi:small subunit ribosomal protein S8
MSTTTTDPIADMLSRIRNAVAVNKHEIAMPHSNVKESVARLLKDSHFVDDIAVEDAPVGKSLRVVINQPLANSRITEIARLSKPGRRLYVKAEKIPTVMRGRGIVIVSTSKGIMTGTEAKKRGIGGELICKVY